MMPNFDKDFEAGRALLTSNGLPVFEAPIHLEGGSIHSDGQGTMVSPVSAPTQQIFGLLGPLPDPTNLWIGFEGSGLDSCGLAVHV